MGPGHRHDREPPRHAQRPGQIGGAMMKRRAFTVTEMLFVLAFFGAVLLMATRLWVESMRVVSRGSDAYARVASFDQMVRALRQDVWGASGIEVTDQQSVRLAQVNGSQVNWKIGD